MSDTYRFGPFELDPRTAELRRNGEPVPLQLQPARILVLLVERAGALVTREEIRARVWPDRVVDYEQGLNYAIRQIRSALGDDAEAPAYVETLPRRGYRLAVTVERGPERTPVSARRQRILAFALAGLVLAAGGVAALSTVGRPAIRRSRAIPTCAPARRS
jgi:DNA-binding winged helix-turn-helix (wHTH) protein